MQISNIALAGFASLASASAIFVPTPSTKYLGSSIVYRRLNIHYNKQIAEQNSGGDDAWDVQYRVVTPDWGNNYNLPYNLTNNGDNREQAVIYKPRWVGTDQNSITGTIHGVFSKNLQNGVNVTVDVNWKEQFYSTYANIIGEPVFNVSFATSYGTVRPQAGDLTLTYGAKNQG